MSANTPLHVELSERSYPIFFNGLAVLATKIEDYIGTSDRILLVSDTNVAPLYLKPLRTRIESSGGKVDSFIIPAGEESKSPSELKKLYDWALSLEPNRETPLVALGGGVVGDLAGFAAATLLRGLPLIQCPTSVVAQVDSAIGGKTGINHVQGKNLIGAFHQPAFVLVDTQTLQTLPGRERLSGFSEIVKHAVIADSEFVRELDAKWNALLDPTDASLSSLIPRAAGIKTSIVSQDEREAGVRTLLNFGHTFGHAIERVTGYGMMTHGEAVAIGMRAAIHLSASMAKKEKFPLEQPLPISLQDADQLIAKLRPPPLPTTIENRHLIEAMTSDKKRTRAGLRFVVLKRTGEATIASNIPIEWIEQSLHYARFVDPDTVT